MSYPQKFIIGRIFEKWIIDYKYEIMYWMFSYTRYTPWNGRKKFWNFYSNKSNEFSITSLPRLQSNRNQKIAWRIISSCSSCYSLIQLLLVFLWIPIFGIKISHLFKNSIHRITIQYQCLLTIFHVLNYIMLLDSTISSHLKTVFMRTCTEKSIDPLQYRSEYHFYVL